VILPYEGAPPNIVAFAWDNLDPTKGGAVWYHFDSAGHRLIVEFDSVPYFAVSGKWEKAEVVLYDSAVPTPTGDNAVVIQYHSLNYPQALSVGLQNSDGSAGLCYTWNDWYPRVSAPLKPRTALRLEACDAAALVQGPDNRARHRPRAVQVRPNPCRGRAEVSARAGSRVSVYSSDGRRVAVLQVRHGTSGWDSGTVRPGLYFFRAEEGDAARLTVVR
jgi:hypothetical protein